MTDKIAVPGGLLGAGDIRKLDLASQLADKAHKDAITKIKEHQDKIDRITGVFMDLVIKEGCTWSDFGEIIKKFNDLTSYVFPRQTIENIKKSFDESTK